jgi:HlyD family secretion protein
VPAATDLDAAQAALDRAVAAEAAARAAVVQAEATLRTNQTNLTKAAIRSPIDGVVLTRSVEPGNAVAASLQAVTLFTVAEDLSHMKLSVNVDEADVGQIQVGQKAQFTVSAWPNRKYPAVITRVAYGSTITDNVVTYTTDLEVANPDLTLRPGMTATATIAATEHKNVLLVPRSALNFSPTAASAKAASGSKGIVSMLIPARPAAARAAPAVTSAAAAPARSGCWWTGSPRRSTCSWA